MDPGDWASVRDAATLPHAKHSGCIELPLDVFWQLRRELRRLTLTYRGASVVRLPPTLAHLQP